MTKRIGIGSSNFRELIDDDWLFVDKTLLIKEIINDKSKVRLITRPRRWGKTLNMSMRILLRNIITLKRHYPLAWHLMEKRCCA